MSYDLGTEGFKEKYHAILAPHTIPFENDTSEFEIKCIAKNGTETFSKILNSLPMLEFKSHKATKNSRPTWRPTEAVSLLEPVVYFKDNILGNFGLDTIPERGRTGLDVIRNEHQLRQRFSLRPDLDLQDPYAVGVSQCSVKNLFSSNPSSNRVEIEGSAPHMGSAVSHFLQAEKHRLPGFFSDLLDRTFRVSTVFLTSRASYHLVVSLPEDSALVVFEVSNDHTRNFTPNLSDKTGPDMFEVEPEAKDVFFTKGGVMTNQKRLALYEKAEVVLRKYLEDNFGDELSPSPASKLERSLNDTASYYGSNVTPMFNRNNNLSPKEIFQRGAQQALALGTSMQDIDLKHRKRLLELAKEMTKPCDLLKARKGIEKQIFGIEGDKLQRARFAKPTLVANAS